MTANPNDCLQEFKRMYRVKKCIDNGKSLLYVFDSTSSAYKEYVEANSLIEKLKLKIRCYYTQSNYYFTIEGI